MNHPDNVATTDDLAVGAFPHVRARRHDGWTPGRQRAFLDGIAAGCTVREACARVGLSPASVYVLRQSPAGRDFALGWDAANLRARKALHDVAICRVIEGFEERITRPNGDVIVRHRHDNGLILRMLDRLDRYASSDGPEALAAAREVESDFGNFLDSIADSRDAALALVRAPDDSADLVLADRADWTLDQWRRAEASGLLFCAEPQTVPETADSDEVEQLVAPDTAFGRQFVQLNDAADERVSTPVAPPQPALPAMNRAARRASEAKGRRKTIVRPIAASRMAVGPTEARPV